jgi:hypothetical protein
MGGFRVSSAFALAALFALQPVCTAADPSNAGNITFGDIPFDAWAASGNHTGIHWEVETPSPALSSHQRLELRIRADLDVREMAKRGGKTELITLAQLSDSGGKTWRTQGTMKSGTWIGSAFVLPGDYELQLAAFDPDSRNYSFLRRKIHAAALKTDPLTAAWQNLPNVEWAPSDLDIPDSWFLPSIQGRLNLPIAVHRPVHIDVVLNATPGGKASGSVTELRRQMEALIPALKVISELGLPEESSIDISLLDLVHQRVAFSQDHVRDLNWKGLRSFFTGFNPGIVDVATLGSSWKMTGFFEDELHQFALAADHNTPGDGHAVIVLSAPAFFDGPKAEDTAGPDKVPGSPDGNRDGSKVFYIRYRPVPPELLNPRRRLRPGMRILLPPPRPIFSFALALDDLEKPLPPGNSRIFDAVSPDEFRRVLAAVIDQIGKL